MATTSPIAEGKGAKRRSGIPTRAAPSTTTTAIPRLAPEVRRLVEDGGDSGLSSECTTPTNGSPPPRQPKQELHKVAVTGQIPRRKMVDIIAASKARLQEYERLANNRTARLLSSRSSTESPRSLDSTRRQLFSPLKSTRNVQSPSLDSGDEGSLRIERGTYSYMFQDIVSIKTMLLKLKRVLQESGENGLTRTDTLNPFDNTLKNGLFYNLNDGNTTTDASTSPNDGRDAVADELADLRRQVVFLQGQGEDKDRMIQSLQSQLAKYQNANNGEIINDNSPTLNGKGESKETSNAATQTEKLRPVSAGPSILQGLPQDNGMGPLVSWSDSWSSQQSASQRSSGLSDVSSITGGKLSSASSSRRSSSDSQRAALRGLRLGNGQAQQQSPPESPKIRAARTKSVEAADGATTTTPPPTAITRSAIPTPRRLAAPTLIPRAARAVSATGRAHNS